MDGSWDVYLASSADFFAGADDITKEREPGMEIIERTPQSLIITSSVPYYHCHQPGFSISLQQVSKVNHTVKKEIHNKKWYDTLTLHCLKQRRRQRRQRRRSLSNDDGNGNGNENVT